MSLDLAMVGAGAFGAIIGWYTYYINRYRTQDIRLSDLVSLVGVIGGGTVLGLFGSDKQQFGAYGIGLFIGFFGYLVVLLLMVARSSEFSVEWFLDGRRKNPGHGSGYGSATRPTATAMGSTSTKPSDPEHADSGTASGLPD
jgi:hypothetical protein